MGYVNIEVELLKRKLFEAGLIAHEGELFQYILVEVRFSINCGVICGVRCRDVAVLSMRPADCNDY